MTEILLTSEKLVKELTNISDNLSGKFVAPAIREAQEIGLQGIVGTALYGRLKKCVSDKESEGAYFELLNEAQYYLAYSAVVEILPKVSYKIGNVGVVKTSDENVTPASREEIDAMMDYYQSKADYYCERLQGWVLDNRERLPELTENDCRKIHANLYSSASCGIWLGGARGKHRRW